MDVERKVLVIGAAGAGKSTFVIQWLYNHFVEEYDPTIEDSYRKRVSSDGVILLLDVMDTAGFLDSDRDPTSNTVLYYSAEQLKRVRSHLIIIVYDITNRTSFERVPDYWYKAKEIVDAQGEESKPVVLLIGAKLDLQDKRQVNTSEGQQMARDLEMMFGELSSKTREGFDETLDEAIKEIAINNRVARRLKPSVKVSPSHQAGRMSSLLKSPIFSDVTLTLNTHRWPAHKFILAARSPVFATILNDTEIKEVPIKGNNITAEGVTALLHFIYTGLVDFNPKIAIEVQALSKEYEIGTIGDMAAEIAKKGSYYPTPESLSARTKQLSEDLGNFYAKFHFPDHSIDHPAFDVALKPDEGRPILGSRALLALNSKYFLNLFEKDHSREIEIDLERAALERISTWIYRDTLLHSSVVRRDCELLRVAASLELPKPFTEGLESQIATAMMSIGITDKDWPELLNQTTAEQLKPFVEWNAAVKYRVLERPEIWKKINKKSRKNIRALAEQMGHYTPTHKKECGIL